MNGNKPRILKDYEKLPEDIKEQIKLAYPEGYTQNLVTYTDREGKLVSALPFEAEECYYLVKMTKPKPCKLLKTMMTLMMMAF